MLVRNHARSMVTCDFLVVVSPVANSLCVRPDGARDKAHRALQGHRTSNHDRDLAAASRHQSYRFLIGDRDAIFSTAPVRERCIYRCVYKG